MPLRGREVEMNLEDYILGHIDEEPELLRSLFHEANLRLVNGRMASGHLQGRILKMFVAMIRPMNVLELGTFAGYSAISMAEALPEGGKIYTFEIKDELEDFARRWIDCSGLADKIELIIGDGLKEAPKLGVEFDMVFVDSDKRKYIEAYEMALGLLRKGGFMFIDNTLWDSHVVDERYLKDKQTQGILQLNDHIKADERVEKVILPFRDGMTIVRKL